MRRRDFIALAAGVALARPLAAHAQGGDRVRRIAVLMSNAEDDPEGRARAAAFLQGLRDLGWTDGHNLRIEWRWAGGDVGRIRAHAAEIAERAPELVVANGTANLSAVRQAIRSIPIVFVVVNDPVGQGFISSLAHPGGNITGFTFVEYAMLGKSLDLLRQVAPAARRIVFLFNPDTSPYYERFCLHSRPKREHSRSRWHPRACAAKPISMPLSVRSQPSWAAAWSCRQTRMSWRTAA